MPLAESAAAPTTDLGGPERGLVDGFVDDGVVVSDEVEFEIGPGDDAACAKAGRTRPGDERSCVVTLKLLLRLATPPASLSAARDMGALRPSMSRC